MTHDAEEDSSMMGVPSSMKHSMKVYSLHGSS